MIPQLPIFLVAVIISLTISETSVSSMRVFSTLWRSVLGWWKVPSYLLYQNVEHRWTEARHTAVNGDVEPPGNQLLNPLYDVCVLRKVNNLDSRFLLRENQTAEDAVDAYDARGALHEREARGALADWTQALHNENHQQSGLKGDG